MKNSLFWWSLSYLGMLFQTLLLATNMGFFLIFLSILHLCHQPIAFNPAYSRHEELFIAFLLTVPLCLFEDFKSLYFNHLVLLYKINWLYFSCRPFYFSCIYRLLFVLPALLCLLDPLQFVKFFQNISILNRTEYFT